MNVNFEKVKQINIVNNDMRIIDSFELTGASLQKPSYVLTLRRKAVDNIVQGTTAVDIWRAAKHMSMEEFKAFYQTITPASGGTGE